MKSNRIHIALWMFIGAALLFNQVGLGFLHDRHDAHEFHIAARKNQTVLLNHGDHCRVCSLEVLFHIVLPVAMELRFETGDQVHVLSHVTDAVLSDLPLRPGRAPPVNS